MILLFDGRWRFTPPADGVYYNETIPPEAAEEFFQLISKLATQAHRKMILEHFKRHYCGAIGTTYVSSSSPGWAETDLRTSMDEAAKNAPLFIDAFYDGCQTLVNINPKFFVPDELMINKILIKHHIGYEIRLRALLLREDEHAPPLVEVPEQPPTLAEKTVNLMQASLRRSEELLTQGYGREAVQESLWLLETVSTAFRGTSSKTGSIEGKYFNQIVRELRKAHPGGALDRMLEWTSTLHGFLSSPTGGGVRHGLDLNEGFTVSPTEARLYCNLIRSYLGFLISEHERIVKEGE